MDIAKLKEVIEKYCSFMPVEIFFEKANAEQEYETIDDEIALFGTYMILLSGVLS